MTTKKQELIERMEKLYGNKYGIVETFKKLNLNDKDLETIVEVHERFPAIED